MNQTSETLKRRWGRRLGEAHGSTLAPDPVQVLDALDGKGTPSERAEILAAEVRYLKSELAFERERWVTHCTERCYHGKPKGEYCPLCEVHPPASNS